MQWGKASKLVMMAVLNQVKSSGKKFKERIKDVRKGKELCRGKSWDNVQERKRIQRRVEDKVGWVTTLSAQTCPGSWISIFGLIDSQPVSSAIQSLKTFPLFHPRSPALECTVVIMRNYLELDYSYANFKFHWYALAKVQIPAEHLTILSNMKSSHQFLCP